MEKATILYVDDEPENLRIFRRLFRKTYTILLAESGEEGLRLLREHAPIAVIVTDQRMPEMTGIEFLDRSLSISPDSIRMVITGFTDLQASIDAINTGRVYRYITKPWDEQELCMTLKRAVESYDLMRKNARLLLDLQQKNKELEQSYSTLKATQEQLIQAEKMASIGRLASRIAHELRNPIQGIKMGLELMQHDIQQMPECRTFLKTFQTTFEHLDGEIAAVNTIVKDLLEYARDMRFDFTTTEINSIIEGILFNMQDCFTAQHITLETQYGELGPLRADGIRVRQVLINLVQNAVEAVGDGGTIVITTSTTEDDKIQILVHDNGCGIPAEQQQRIFEPFFTTKDRGVGLGMAIVHRIIEAHQGRIDIDSEVGCGTTFTIQLPRQREKECYAAE
ncbi:hypothetical protein CSB45_02365 [candidate division KSB3 bacterium]|uniref:histidine kinase n=1 Tax=candidate division KSB3 bacterium TaxID=2044937 RepID=A0A2G6E9U9_9BACT|nr:MAG: hypothetical protein CSB45_02365 [candidate division KSB3 bacterium]PIE30924.1 MAG: hypothetical protein CSA57_00975 [candidate division KSB3 bacterium]